MTSTSESTARNTVVWRFVDGKPGHEKQSAALLQALAEHAPLEVHSLDVRFKTMFLRQILGHALHRHVDIPAPDLIVGVGHGTHLLVLLAGALCGGKTVVLMKPSLPHHLFDLVFVPQHDRYWRKGNLIETRGVICPSLEAEKDPSKGLVLLGGENKHFHWDNAELAQQIRAIAASDPDIRWCVCDSRRTPPGLAALVDDIPNVEFTPWQRTGAGFMELALAETPYVWVTVDSVSMLYEALSSRATVGVVVLRAKREGRTNKLMRGVQLLKSQGHVHLSSDGYQLISSLPPPHFSNENLRCAEIVRQRLIG